MDLLARFEQETESMPRIKAASRCSLTPVFGDLMWGEQDLRLDDFLESPGVMLETTRRICVFQHIKCELRYYAGGWNPYATTDPDFFVADQDRVLAEGHEIGVMSLPDAITFADLYLLVEKPFSAIQVPRWLFNSQPPAR